MACMYFRVISIGSGVYGNIVFNDQFGLGSFVVILAKS